MMVAVLSSVTYVNAQITLPKTWEFTNVTNWPTSSTYYATNRLIQELSLIATDQTVATPVNPIMINRTTTPVDFGDGFTGTRAYRFNGSSQGTDKNTLGTNNLPAYRYLSFSVNGPFSLKIWFTSGAGSARILRVTDGSNTLSADMSSASSTNPQIFTANGNYTGTVYICCPNSITIGGGLDIFKIEVTPTTTWNSSSSWSNGTPNSTTEAIIEGTYSTGTNGSFTTKKLTVNSGSLTVNSGTNLTVQNELINNAGTNGIVVENNANLIQGATTTVNSNTGAITVKRNSNPLYRLDYTLWSSPVVSQNLAAFSPLTSRTPNNRFYTYDTASSAYNNTFDPTATTFAAGTGYLIRMPNEDPSSLGTGTPYYLGTAAITYNGVFTGVPNNGDVPFTLSTTGNGYNLVGNPYPSPITMATLVSDNSAVISTTLYFWRKTNGAGTAYCTYNTTGSVFTTNGNAQSVDPAGVIQTGQGFFVKAIAAGSLVFKNGQRVANTTGQFFRTKQVATPSRIWLNATNVAGDFSQMAVNYTEGATQGVDDFDGKYINDSPVALTSSINGGEYTIQGRPAFDATDIVPLNFKTDVAGDYTIAIDHADGLFAAGQTVILADATTGTETDLTTSAYTFTAKAGTANSRFSLKYQKTLGTNQSVFNDNNVAVYKNKETLYVDAGDATIANIEVYNVQGKLVTELKNVKATSAVIANLKASNQVLVVKITTQENKIVTRKVVN